MLIALVLLAASARPIVIQLGEWYRDIQEAMIFAEHLKGSLQRVIYRSRLLGRPQRFIVYLPPGYGKPEQQGRRYPVLYLLHGCPGQPRDWLVKGDVHESMERLIDSRAVQEMILVMADGEGTHGRFDCTLFMDRADGSYPAETVFVRELVPLVDRRFRTQAGRDSRALLGVSSGGFAALNLGVRHPELFGVLASYSGYFRSAADPRAIRPILDGGATGWAANSPADRIAAVPPGLRPHIYLSDGTEDPLFSASEAFARQLQSLGIDHELRVTAGGHGWGTWRRSLPSALAWISARLGREVGRSGARAFERSGPGGTRGAGRSMAGLSWST